MFTTVLRTFCTGLLLSAATSVFALEPASHFGNHMVLQREMDVPVRGTAEPGAEVMIEFAGQTVSSQTNRKGTWKIHLKPLQPSAELVRNTPYDGIRLMHGGAKPFWQPANAETVPQFSAELFAFGERLHRELNVPIGLIVGAVGGSSSGWWLPAEIWESSDRCQAVIAEFAKTWNRDQAQKVYEEQLAQWKKTVEEAKTKGVEPRGRAPEPVVEPGVFRHGKLGEFFDRFIRTSVGYGIRGVLWDQDDFPFLFVQKPSGLGNAWTNENPITREANPFTELPSWIPNDGDGRFLYIRLMLDNKNAWMVPAIDLGSNPTVAAGPYPHHPINKWGYGNRAAEVALQKVYQQPNTQAYGPIYESHQIDGPRVIVHFSEVGEGLAFRHANEIRGFALAGEDGKWHWAKATIEDETVVVTSEAVPAPVRVRYAWGFSRTWANLFNKNGLPALSFETQAVGALNADDKDFAKLDTDGFPYTFNEDGEATLPQIFFFNTDKGNDTYLRPQVEMAAKAGVHIYSFPLWVPMKYPTDEPNFAYAEGLLEKFITIDPEAKFLVRLVLGPNRSWKKYREQNASNAGEYTRYADGTTSNTVSFASKDFLEPTTIQLRKIVRHLERKYPERILVYQVAGAHSEFFDFGYRPKGPDYSEANTAAFGKYLRERYPDVAALRKAWGDDSVSFDNAALPMPEKGRFPMRLVLDRRIRAFYRPVENRAWIDYSQFYSKLMSDHLIRWCRIVKEETGGNKMTAAFYGYLFILPGSFSGHLNLASVLNSEHVDVLCSPVSCSDRAPGGPGSFMSPVDSVVLHKKLRINEDDTRTHVIDEKAHGQKPRFSATTSLDETIGVIDRNIANILSHGAGIWWMDLGASGMFNSQEVWDLIKRRQDFFRKSEEAKKSYSATVQLIADEESKTHLADDYGFDRSVLHNVLTALNRSSATVESYLFSDYVSGKTPRADLVVFANTFKMSAEQRAAVQTRLARDKSHRVWCFLPGYIDGEGNHDTATVEKLTGFTVTLQPGKVGTRGTHGNFKGLTWNAGGNNLNLEERPVVDGEGCEIIGQYVSDRLPSSAMKSSNGIYSFYLGSPGANAELIRGILRTAGVHLWTDQPAVVTRNNKYLFVYTGKEGKLSLNVPEGIKLTTIKGEAVRPIANKVSLSMDGTGVQWFEYFGIGSTSFLPLSDPLKVVHPQNKFLAAPHENIYPTPFGILAHFRFVIRHI